MKSSTYRNQASFVRKAEISRNFTFTLIGAQLIYGTSSDLLLYNAARCNLSHVTLDRAKKFEKDKLRHIFTQLLHHSGA